MVPFVSKYHYSTYSHRPRLHFIGKDLPVNVGPPTIKEINMTIKQIKSGKAAGPDNIPAEALKSDVAVTAKVLNVLFIKIWNDEQVPTDWKEGHLINISKKGNLSKFEDYRGITLFSIPEKSSTGCCEAE
ncbi:unnamed protein product [Schistosoma mattheei]|uniref:Uncharacterized protein n=1 Tax=Schistosoma mattheei TaxID=31246 RepID=A0A183NYV5_9TREM|nr:unnamed protein product [Schistosoma mattheei]